MNFGVRPAWHADTQGEKLRQRESEYCLMVKDGTSFAPGLILKTSKSLPLCLHVKDGESEAHRS